MARSKVWLGVVFLWEQFCRIPPNWLKAGVHAVVGLGCLHLSLESQAAITNATLDLVQKLVGLIGSASALFAIINALHKPPKPTIVTPVQPTSKG